MPKATPVYYATGRRKRATARVYLRPGNGQFLVNKRTLEEFFPREVLKMVIHQPLNLTETAGALDIYVNVRGGGMSGQAGAIKHGISRALIKLNPDFRPALKKGGFLTRDARIKERKKYGQPGARKRFQFSKR
jgi:small subunit ribosomal protein S9